MPLSTYQMLDKPYHRQPAEALTDVWISSISRWADKKWILDNETWGANPAVATIYWDFQLPDKSTFADSQWASLQAFFKRFAWSLLVDPRGGRHLKPGSMGHVSTGIRSLVTWMIGNHYLCIEQLDVEASWEYFDHVVQAAAEIDDGNENDGEGICFPHLYDRLAVLTRLHTQGEALAEAGFEVMCDVPFDGKTAGQLAKEATTKAEGWIPPFPDVVAVRVMASAIRMLGVRADDVIRLANLALESYEAGGPRNYLGLGQKVDAKTRATSRVLRGFTFSTEEGQTTPWREKIRPVCKRIYVRNDAGARMSNVNVFGTVRHLIEHVTAACIITIQSTTGVRVSEIAALNAGIDSETGLPSCVKVKTSRTGLNDIFYLESSASKIHDGRVMEWVLGSRPKGSDYLPPPIRAIRVLHDLWLPWRERIGAKALILNFGIGPGLLKKDNNIGRRISSNKILVLTRSFICEYGNLSDLPDQLQTKNGVVDIFGYKTGQKARTHQWRKTFANFVIRVDSSMLPALAQHFKHLSLAMTEQGYIGNDPELLQAVDSIRVERSTLLFYEAATGKRPNMAGRMAELVEEHIKELSLLVEGKSEESAYESVRAWVIKNDLRIWFAPHGKCFIGLDPSGSRCHEAAGTTPGLFPVPNYATREPSECLGCKCYLVDGEHGDFWVQRYTTNQTALLEGRRAGRGHEYRVAEERVKQSAGILRKLGVDVPSIELDKTNA